MEWIRCVVSDILIRLINGEELLVMILLGVFYYFNNMEYLEFLLIFVD